MKTHPANFRAAERQEAIKVGHLYLLTHKGTNYHLTNYDADISVTGLPGSLGSDPQTFTAGQIGHSVVEQTDDLNANKMTLTVGVNSSAAANEFRAYFLQPVTAPVDILVARVNSASLPGPVAWGSDTYTIFKGLALEPAFDDYSIAFFCSTYLLQHDGQIPRFFFTKLCQHDLYDQTPGTCLVNKEQAAFRLVTTAAAVDRRHRSLDIADTTLNGQTIVGSWFEGGLAQEMEADLTTVKNYLTIVAAEVLPSSGGTRLRLNWWPPSLQVGSPLRVYRACNHSWSDCKNVFGNGINFGGTPYIPTNNPALDGIRT